MGSCILLRVACAQCGGDGGCALRPALCTCARVQSRSLLVRVVRCMVLVTIAVVVGVRCVRLVATGTGGCLAVSRWLACSLLCSVVVT